MEPSPDEPPSIFRKPSAPTPRAERLERGDVPWILTVKLASGLEVRLLNISSTGTLIESGARLANESVTEVRLCSPDSQIVIPARFVRSEIADVTALGVRYQIGLAFDDYVPLDRPSDGDAAPAAASGELRARVSEALEKAARAGGGQQWLERASKEQLNRLAWLLTETNTLVEVLASQN